MLHVTLQMMHLIIAVCTLTMYAITEILCIAGILCIYLNKTLRAMNGLKYSLTCVLAYALCLHRKDL